MLPAGIAPVAPIGRAAGGQQLERNEAAEPGVGRLVDDPHSTFADLLDNLSGTFQLGVGNKFDKAAAKAYPVGGVAVMPAGMPMFAYAAGEETIIQVHGTGPWGVKYLDPADDPLKK